MSTVRRRLPDEVRAAAVRAGLSFSLMLVALIVAVLASYAGTTLLTPALVVMAIGVFGTAWGLLEILVSRQIAAQKRRGPNSASPLDGSRERGRRPAGRRAPLQG
ncbi:hypothetical protein KNE206_46560 [Kitasatospora sp. NE20-6]|uniref:hypothetical protein n=1 Tax=Kitasatospora sp. NE20-6 TaxID=2859066 RepID=UPI0034DC7AA3